MLKCLHTVANHDVDGWGLPVFMKFCEINLFVVEISIARSSLNFQSFHCFSFESAFLNKTNEKWRVVCDDGHEPLVDNKSS